MNVHRLTGLAGCLWLGVVGCATKSPQPDLTSQRHLLALVMPSRIEIVEPFTRVRSFDSDATPDGIELLLQAVNALDNPGLMIAGHLRVDLFEFVSASADPKGKRLEHWDVDLSTTQQQQTYWNALTQMYELRLGIDPTRIPPADKYVLVVTYQSPLGDRLTDEFTIEYQATATAPRSSRRAGR